MNIQKSREFDELLFSSNSDVFTLETPRQRAIRQGTYAALALVSFSSVLVMGHSLLSAKEGPLAAKTPSCSLATAESLGAGLIDDGQASSPSAVDAAHDCLDRYENGRIALIDYAGLPSDQDHVIEQDLETRLTAITNGLITADITVIQPSEDALSQRSAESKPGECLQSQDIHKMSSVTADTTMDLKSYDYVVGLNDRADCNGKTAGFALASTNRYAEVLGVNEHLRLYANDPVFARQQQNEYISGTALHEIMHLYGLGHAGESNVYIRNNREATQDGNVLDIGNILSAGIDEYARSLIPRMTAEQDGTYLALNSVQQYQLEWPQRILDRKTSMLSADIAAGPLTFTDETDIPTFGVISLETSGMTASSSDQLYSHLILRPAWTPIGYQFVEISVVEKSTKNVVALGTVYHADKSGPATKIKAGNITVDVAFIMNTDGTKVESVVIEQVN